MCLILLAHDCHPSYRLVLAANRDEFYARPTAPLAFWDDAPEVAAGRDLQGGGTWLGVTRSGRVAAVTNVREPGRYRRGVASRGLLVRDFLVGKATPEAYLADLAGRAGRAGRYNGFNLLVGDRDTLWHASNRGGRPAPVPPGIHGLSNHLLDTPWPKVQRGKEALAAALRDPGPVDAGRLLDILADRTVPPDDELPDTGVGIAWERILGSAFIAADGYGTRSSSVLLVGRDGGVELLELTHEPDGPAAGRPGGKRDGHGGGDGDGPGDGALRRVSFRIVTPRAPDDPAR